MVRDRVFITMVSVSMLFHLSMVTLFSIYVYVPVSRPKYAQLDIKYLELGRTDLASSDLTLRIPAMDNALTPEAESGVPEPAEMGPLAPPERLTLQLPEIAPPAFDSCVGSNAGDDCNGDARVAVTPARFRGTTVGAIIREDRTNPGPATRIYFT